MSFLAKISGKAQEIPQQAKKLTNRFLGDGEFMKMGATYHAPRTNSSEEIIASLKLLATGEANKADKMRKHLIELSDKGGYDIEKRAKKGSQDVVEAALTLQAQNVETLQKILDQGGTLSRAHIQEYQELLQIANVAQSIRAAELKEKEITEFLKIAGDMPQRHLSLAHDVVDLSNIHAFINDEIFPSVNLNTIGNSVGSNKLTTLMGHILGMLPKLSKENPKAVELAETVVSHSDASIAKFFLREFLYNAPNTPEQTAITEKLVPTFAKEILKGMPSMDLGANCKENRFLQIILNCCNPNSKPENIKILPEILKNAGEQGGKRLDISGFLTKNVNLA